MGARSHTEFIWEPRLNKVIKALGPDGAANVAKNIASFEDAYRASTVNEDLPRRFQFKIVHRVRGSYELWQIYAGNDYRVIALFPKERSVVYWVYAFKKTKDNNRDELELAKKRAKDYWEEIKGG